MPKLPANLKSRSSLCRTFAHLRDAAFIRLDRPQLALLTEPRDQLLQPLDLARLLAIDLVQLEAHSIPVLASGSVGVLGVPGLDPVHRRFEAVPDGITDELPRCRRPGLPSERGHR